MIVAVDIKEVREEFSKSQWPCLDYCKKYLSKCKEDTRLEVWNYEREKPEADWIVPNVRKYIKSGELLKRRGSTRF